MPFAPVGYGVNFKAATYHDAQRCELLDILYEKAAVRIRTITLFWIDHDKIVLILHDDDDYA